MCLEDTIAAIATAPGEGGIGIVRISGEMAGVILRSIFVPIKNETQTDESITGAAIAEIKMEPTMEPMANRRMTYGHIVDFHAQGEEKIDEVLAVFMKGPHTYTTEDVVEIYCHGSMVSLKKTLALALHHGARLAEPGEFTKRAFLNGRIDLSQAEAVIDLIRAKTEDGYEAAFHQLSGKLSQNIKERREELVEVLVDLAVNIDYPDEDIQAVSYENLKKNLEDIETQLSLLLKTLDTGRILREGLHTVIVGKPNVGKSSLMNRLLGENRSIVTDVPGTTRDTIEELLSVKGIFLKITDTAGIRETHDAVEKIGVARSKETFKKADLILFILDGSLPLSKEDQDIMEEIQDKKSIVIINKTDKEQVITKEEIQKWMQGKTILETSMTEGTGLSAIEKEISDMVYNGEVKILDDVTVTNVRHGALIEEALQAVRDGLISTEMGEALEIIEIDVRRAWELLGQIIGETVEEDLIDEIFSRFCLGK